MNFISNMLDRPSAEAFGWMLVHSAWELATIGATTAAVLAMMRRAAAHSRYAVALGGLLLMALVPVVTYVVLMPREVTTSHPTQPWVSAPAEPSVFPVSARTIAPAPLPLSARLLAHIRGALPAAEALYLIGLLLFSMRLALGYARLRMLVHRAHPIGTSGQASLTHLALHLGLHRVVRLLESPLVEVPAVVGILRPVILLPITGLTGLTPQQLEAILAHELAHIRRYDHLILHVQTLIETVLFYHPAIWWLSARVRQERENCCDDIAVALTGNALDYARALESLEHRRATPRHTPAQLIAAARGGVLLPRIRRLLDVAPSPARPLSHAAAGLLILIALGITFYALGCAQQNKTIVAKPATQPVGPQVLIKMLIYNVDAAFVDAHAGAALPAPGADGVTVTKSREEMIAALGDKALSELVARPYILAVDNQEARMMVGQQIAVSSVKPTQYTNVGTMVDVTPHIAPDGNSMQLDFAFELSRFTGETLKKGDVETPVIERRSGKTTLDLANGETAMVINNGSLGSTPEKPARRIVITITPHVSMGTLPVQRDAAAAPASFTVPLRTKANAIVNDLRNTFGKGTPSPTFAAEPNTNSVTVTCLPPEEDGIRKTISMMDTFALSRGALLDDTATFAVNNLPLEAALNRFHDATGASFNIDWPALHTVGIEKETPITLSVRDQTYRQILKQLLAQTSKSGNALDFTSDDGVLIVSTADSIHAGTNMLIRVLDIREFIAAGIPGATFIDPATGLFDPGKPPATADQQKRRDEIVNDLIHEIQTTVDPASWETAGGTIGSIRELNGQLIINQTMANQRAIRKLFQQLHDTRVGPPPGAARDSDTDAKPPTEFFLRGAVARPGVYSLGARKITLKQALAAAGTDFAKAKDLQIRLIRRTGDREETPALVHLDALLAGTEADPILQPNDFVQVETPPPATAPAPATKPVANSPAAKAALEAQLQLIDARRKANEAQQTLARERDQLAEMTRLLAELSQRRAVDGMDAAIAHARAQLDEQSRAVQAAEAAARASIDRADSLEKAVPSTQPGTQPGAAARHAGPNQTMTINPLIGFVDDQPLYATNLPRPIEGQIDFRQLKNAKAANVAALLNAMFTPATAPAPAETHGTGAAAPARSSRLYADYDTRTNTVILNGPPDQVKQALETILKLDQPPATVPATKPSTTIPPATQPGTGAANSPLDAPTASTIDADTKVSIPEGGTLLLGGQKLASKKAGGVPSLSKMPGVNRLISEAVTLPVAAPAAIPAGTQPAATQPKFAMEYMQLKNAKATEVAQVLESMFTPSTAPGAVVPAPSERLYVNVLPKNTIAVTGPPELIKLALAAMKNIDAIRVLPEPATAPATEPAPH